MGGFKVVRLANPVRFFGHVSARGLVASLLPPPTSRSHLVRWRPSAWRGLEALAGGTPGMTAALGHTGVLRFVALGDSVTVGLGDPTPDGGWRGWAALLSESLAPPGHVELINLARCGARVRDVVSDQLPYALAGHPTLASVVVGVNDTLRGRFELATIASDLDEAIARLREAGALVLTASLPDPGVMLRIPGLLRHPLARRIQAINTVLDHLAARHGTVHLDLTRHPALYDRHMWGVDRIHPSERGHRLLAQLFAVMLADHGVRLWDRLDPQPAHPSPSAWAQVRWLVTKGTGWVLRRSLDLLPHLVRMGISEWWHRVRKRTARLDARLRSEIDNVLAALAPEPAAGSGVLEDS